MSSFSVTNDIDLKSKLARYGIYSPITDSTRLTLLKKLQKLERYSMNNKPAEKADQQIASNDTESMDTSSNDLNEYEIRNEITKLGYANIPLTDSTRPILSNIIRRKRERNNKLK